MSFLFGPSFFWGSPKPSSPPNPTVDEKPSFANGGGVPVSDGMASAAAKSTSVVNPSAYFQKYGFPGPIHDVANRGEFVSLYDRRMRNPAWVIEHITAESLSADKGKRDQSTFKEDTDIPMQYRARLQDYFRSGYDRGHQAPAADAKYSQKSMDDTFYLTNMCPQVGNGFNRDYWAHFEHFVRGLARQYGSLRVVTGPLYLPKKDPVDGKWKVTYEVIGNPPNVSVPTHFFKIIIGEEHPKHNRGVAVGAFVLPNEEISNETPLKSFYVPIESIERSSGVDFLAKLPENDRRDLCREVKCEVTIREFKQAALPPGKQQLALPPPKN